MPDRPGKDVDYDSLIPPVIDDVERVPTHLRLKTAGGGGGRRMHLVRDVARTDRASYTPEGNVRK